jgi:hypothetical protein
MNLASKRLIASLTLLSIAAVPALAGSIATSTAVGGSSASSASSATSDSVGASSDSSRKAVANAEGPYRIVDATPVPDRPDTVRMTLRPLARADEPLELLVPRPVFERSGLAAGGTVNAHPRPYGVEFAHGETGRAFFLVVNDDWHREMRSTPVSL